MRLKEWQKIILIVIFSFVAAGFILSIFFSGFSSKPGSVPDNAILELVIGGEIVERTVDDPVLEKISMKKKLSIQLLLQAIHKAKIDDKIKGIILRPFPSNMGWGKSEEIRNALADFKRSGKPVYAFLDAAGDQEYYLATVADSIFGAAMGILFTNGFSSEPSFLKGTLAKIGIEADFVAIGKYKNAPDMFTRKNMSGAQREVINSLLDQVFGHYVTTVAQARGIEESLLRRYIDHGFFSLGEAQKKNLIDTLIYYNEFKDFLKTKHGDDVKLISLNRYIQVSPSNLDTFNKNTLALIYGVGVIVTGSESDFGKDGLITSEGMANNIRKAAKDDKIKAIILRINSPGGSGSASDVIWREVVEARKKKPVIVSISDLAASGGYYISMAADSIVAHPNSIIGSIGVFSGKFSFKNLYKKIDLNKEKIKRGINADIFSETQKFTPEQRKIMRGFIEEFYQDFISKVADGRKMSIQAVDKIAQGRVWTGAQGKEIGLIDKLGDFTTAVEMAKKMAGIPKNEKVRIAIYPKLKTFLERVFSGDISISSQNVFPEIKSIPPAFRNTINALPYLRAGEPLFLCTYNF